jgi:hypothetical protein
MGRPLASDILGLGPLGDVMLIQPSAEGGGDFLRHAADTRSYMVSMWDRVLAA